MLTVACSLPAGLLIDHHGRQIRLNGAHVGIDQSLLPANGMLGDGDLRAGGFGLTTLSDDDATTFDEWVASVTKGQDGKPLREPFAPIATGAIKWFKSEADARKEATKEPGSVGGMDPAKDLPANLETADDKPAKK